MKPAEMADIRARIGLSQQELARAIGYKANKNTAHLVISDYENGRKEIPQWIAVVMRVLDVGGITDFIVSYKGPDDRAEFAHQLSLHLRGVRHGH